MAEEPKHSGKSGTPDETRSLGGPAGQQATIDLINFAPALAVEGREEPSQSDALILRQRGARRWTVTLGLIATLLLLMDFGPSVYREGKTWRAEILARQGERLVQQSQIEEAVPTIRSAFMLAPNSPEVMRAMAQILSTLGIPGAITYWNWLLQTNEATDDDRRAAVECAMQNDDYSEVAKLVGTLLSRDGNDSRNLLLAARWRLQRGSIAEAMTYATRAALHDPNNEETVLFLAQLEIKNSALHQKGIDSLLALSESDDTYGLQATNVLAGDSHLKPDEVGRVIIRLKSHPLAGESQRLVAYAMEIKRQPERKNQLLQEAIAAHKNAHPADLAALAEWLISNREAARVFTFIDEDKAFSDKKIFSAYLDALGAQKKWSQVRALLSSARVPLDGYMVELYLSRCASEMGDSQGSDLHWENAVSTANYYPVQSLYLASYAEKMGRNDRAEAVYRALSQEPIIAHVAYLGLLRVESVTQTKTQTLRDLLDHMVFCWPMDETIEQQDIYFNLLMNEKAGSMHQCALDLAARDPENLANHTNLAFSCLRLHDPAGALAAYGHAVVDWSNAPIPDVAIYAAVLYANGQVREAKQVLFSVNRKVLRPELRELVRPIP